MPGTACWINDTPLDRFGFVLERWRGAGTRRRWPTSRVLGRAGVLLADRLPAIDPATLTLEGVLRGDTVAAARAQLAGLLGFCARGLLEVRFADEPARVRFARLAEGTVEGLAPQVIQPVSRLTLALECLDPYAYAVQPTLVRLSGDWQVQAPLGEAPSAPLVTVMGAATNPIIVVRNPAGADVATLGLTVTLGANDFVQVDMAACTITRSVNGVRSDGLGLLSSGDFFALDPADADPLTGEWPRLYVSAGTGTALYRKAYL